MITSNRAQLYCRERGLFVDFLQPSGIYRTGGSTFYLKENQFEGGVWLREHCEWFARSAIAVQVSPALEVVPAPMCGCCGAQLGGSGWTAPGSKLVVDSAEPSLRVWRCERHVGRAPCCIEGCGRTFALSPSHGYDVTYICGKHWREAPRYMRDRVKRLRKVGEKRHWPERLARLHDLAFELAVRSVRQGRHLDMTEINRMFGWDD